MEGLKEGMDRRNDGWVCPVKSLPEFVMYVFKKKGARVEHEMPNAFGPDAKLSPESSMWAHVAKSQFRNSNFNTS